MPKYKYCQMTIYINGVLIDGMFNGAEITYHPKHTQRVKEILEIPDDGTSFVIPSNLERES